MELKSFKDLECVMHLYPNEVLNDFENFGSIMNYQLQDGKHERTSYPISYLGHRYVLVVEQPINLDRITNLRDCDDSFWNSPECTLVQDHDSYISVSLLHNGTRIDYYKIKLMHRGEVPVKGHVIGKWLMYGDINVTLAGKLVTILEQRKKQFDLQCANGCYFMVASEKISRHNLFAAFDMFNTLRKQFEGEQSQPFRQEVINTKEGRNDLFKVLNRLLWVHYYAKNAEADEVHYIKDNDLFVGSFEILEKLDNVSESELFDDTYYGLDYVAYNTAKSGGYPSDHIFHV